ncbi:macrophage mannose receptor 1-like [Mytilus californianus]|uniref:macrophage mannose receptor 1-like n=1 Tax=Mytilus californianus TaxID=6549 RepID=UPI002247A2C2|nr:macrophage mannose receptor 1-like [Mytilus californianus]
MLTFVALFVVFGSGVSALGCEKLWVQFENHCYYSNQMPFSQRKRFEKNRTNSAGMVEEIQLQWAPAQASCKRRGGYLVEIETKAENDFIKKLAQKVKKAPVWLGGTDAAKEGYWVWGSSGKPLTFVDWKKSENYRYGDEPNNYGEYGENCMQLSEYDDYNAWYDVRCQRFRGFICEKPAT